MTEMHHYQLDLEAFTCDPLKYKNGLFHIYSINMHEKIHQNE